MHTSSYVHRILIAGAGTSAWWNAGDEAIFSAMIRDLRSKLPGVQISALSANPNGALAPYEVEEVPVGDIRRMIKTASESDMLILGGGGLFYDYWGFNIDQLFTTQHVGHGIYVDFALLSTLLNKPLMIYAVGVGPLSSETGKSYTKMIFEQAASITVRDEDSKQLLNSLGIPAKKIRVTADPAFGTPKIDLDIGMRCINAESQTYPKRPFLGVVLRDWMVNESPSRDWKPAVSQALDKLVEQYGGTIFFIPFHRQVDRVNDAATAENVRSLMKYGNQTILFGADLSLDEKESILGNCDLVLGMRLHSVIFAIKYGIPVVALAYDPKVSHLLNTLKQTDYLLDMKDLDTNVLFFALQNAYQNRDTLSNYFLKEEKRLAALAQQNATMAVRLLQEKGTRSGFPSDKAEEVIKTLLLEQSMRVHEQQATVQILNAQIAEKEQQLYALSIQVAEKVQQVQALNTQLIARNEQIQALNVQVTAQDEQVQNLMNQVISQDNQIQSVQARLDEIITSTAWRVTQRLWKIRLWLIPHASFRESVALAWVQFIRHPSRSSLIGAFWDMGRAVYHRLPVSLQRRIRALQLARMRRKQSRQEDTAPIPTAEPQPVTALPVDRSEGIPVRSDRVAILAPLFFDYEGNNMFFGGAERYLIELVRLIRQMGYEPEIYQCGTGDWVRYYGDMRVIGLNTGTDMQRLNQRFHEIVPNSALTIYFVFKLAAPRYHASKSIGISHGIYWDDKSYQYNPSIQEKNVRDILEAISHISTTVSVDTNTINWVRATQVGLAEKLVYIPNFVDLNQFQPRQQSGNVRHNDEIAVLYPRRLYKPRGFWLVEKLVPEFLERYPNVAFHFVGKADALEEEAVRALTFKYPERVKWYFLPPERMQEAYAQADIALIPTINGEGTSLSCLEALASGNAVIASNVGGLPDLVLSGFNGLLIEPNVNSLREALHTLLRDPELRQRIAKNGVEVARSFDIQNWRSRWKRILKMYLAERAPFASDTPVIVFPPVSGLRWKKAQKEFAYLLAEHFSRHGIEVFWQQEGARQQNKEKLLYVVNPTDDLYIKNPFLVIWHPSQYHLVENYDQPYIIYCLTDSISGASLDEHLLDTAQMVLMRTSNTALKAMIEQKRPDVFQIEENMDNPETMLAITQRVRQLHGALFRRS